jgi:hypothetical protein
MRRADAECGGSSFLSLVEAQEHEIRKFTEYIQGRSEKEDSMRSKFHKHSWLPANILSAEGLQQNSLDQSQY